MSLQRKIADGLLRHDVSRNDRGSEMNFLSSQKQVLEHHVIARAARGDPSPREIMDGLLRR